jgi:hypothetical protein
MWQLRIASAEQSEKAMTASIYTSKISYGTLPR